MTIEEIEQNTTVRQRQYLYRAVCERRAIRGSAVRTLAVIMHTYALRGPLGQSVRSVAMKRGLSHHGAWLHVYRLKAVGLLVDAANTVVPAVNWISAQEMR